MNLDDLKALADANAQMCTIFTIGPRGTSWRIDDVSVRAVQAAVPDLIARVAAAEAERDDWHTEAGRYAGLAGIAEAELDAARVENARLRTSSIDAEHLESQRTWSRQTFGPGTRLLGVLDHIRKELAEIEADPTDLGEWVDVIILAFDGAWRAGWEPQQIIDAIKAKQVRNEARTWPDWRTLSEHVAIEHVRAIEGES